MIIACCIISLVCFFWACGACIHLAYKCSRLRQQRDLLRRNLNVVLRDHTVGIRLSDEVMEILNQKKGWKW